MHSKHILIVLRVVAAMAAVAVVVSAGNPDNPPGPPETTSSYRLEDIYNRLSTGAAGTQITFTEPISGPAVGTGHTFDETMAVAPQVDDTDGATGSQVVSGTTYWGLQDEAWGPQVGTMPNNGAGSTIVPATTEQSLAAGYWSSANTVQGDSDLIPGNITSGVNLFGVDGAYPLMPVPKTGQTQCYTSTSGSATSCPAAGYPGQDGDYQAGVTWPTPRFITGTTGTTGVTLVVTDTLTGLVWLQDANCIASQYPDFDTDNTNPADTIPLGGVTWQHALEFVAGITVTGPYSNCAAGFSDWRLPNVREAGSLIDVTELRPPGLPDDYPFTGVTFQWFWSSTTEPTDPSDAWAVLLWHNMVLYLPKNNEFRVWPVRGGQ